VLIALVICSLSISLATRFCVEASASPVHAVKSLEKRSVDPKRQHLNRNAGFPAVPAAKAVFGTVVLLDLPVAQPDPVLPAQPVTQSLYNRPPPSSGMIL